MLRRNSVRWGRFSIYMTSCCLAYICFAKVNVGSHQALETLLRNHCVSHQCFPVNAYTKDSQFRVYKFIKERAYGLEFKVPQTLKYKELLSVIDPKRE